MKKALLTALLFGMAAQQLHANGFNYNYVEGQYVKSSMNNVDGSGYAIAGSVALNNNVALNAGYSNDSYDYDIDTNGYNIGLTYHVPITDVTDILFNASLEQSEYSQPLIGSDDDTGYSIGVGIRHKVASAVELNASVYNVSIWDDSAIGVDAAVLVEVSKNF